MVVAGRETPEWHGDVIAFGLIRRSRLQLIVGVWLLVVLTLAESGTVHSQEWLCYWGLLFRISRTVRKIAARLKGFVSTVASGSDFVASAAACSL